MSEHLETFAAVTVGPPMKSWLIFNVRLLVDGGIDEDEVRRSIRRAVGYEQLAERTKR